MADTLVLGANVFDVWVQVPPPAPTKKSLLSTKTKVAFLNDGCLRQMMLESPMMTASPNDAWLRHILWQTSHHCGTKWSNIIFAEQMHHIAAGDASLKHTKPSGYTYHSVGMTYFKYRYYIFLFLCRNPSKIELTEYSGSCIL